MEIQKRIGQNVRKFRLEKGWSQEEFAHQSGIHQTYVSGIETGARNPTATVIQKIADALGVPPGKLLE